MYFLFAYKNLWIYKLLLSTLQKIDLLLDKPCQGNC